MSAYRSKLTDKLVAPKHKKDFAKDWARRILVDYMCRTDPDWLLGDVLKVLDVTAKENPHPGMLSDSYVVEVTYKQGEEDMDSESWFVKVPNCNATTLKDEVEAFMYNKMFPLMQEFADLKARSQIQMPIPIVFHACYDEDNKAKNHLVMENLRDQGYRPLRPETCGLVFMRAAMTSLATVHATAYAYQNELGGKAALLSKFPLLTEDNFPRSKLLKERTDALILPYLFYMGSVQPDLQPQLSLLTKFHRFLLGVYHTLRRDKDLNNLKILIHGDSKIDNFMFKRAPGRMDDTYVALMIDWQGACYDLLSGDLMWTLYGFLKNLPDKNATVDTFLDYSITFYHQELLRILKALKVDPEKINLPTHEYDATTLVKKGFVKEFLQTVVIKPLIVIKDPELLINWFKNRDREPPPPESSIFKSGSNYVNFIHLYMTIATEIGVFHDLATMCISAMKEVMFGGGDDLPLDDTDDELERERAKNATVKITDDEKDELAKILGGGFASTPQPTPVVETPVVTEVPVNAETVSNANHEKATENIALNEAKEQNEESSAQAKSNQEEIVQISNDIDQQVVNIKNEPAALEQIESPPTGLPKPVDSNNETIQKIIAETQSAAKSNSDDEVVSGVVYIRTSSQMSDHTSSCTLETSEVIQINGDNFNSSQTQTEPTNILAEIKSEPVKVVDEVLLNEKPLPKAGTKKRKKGSATGSGARNRANRQKEVESIHTIQDKIKELKQNVRQTTDNVFQLSDLCQNCDQKSDYLVLQMAVAELKVSVADFYRVCADEIANDQIINDDLLENDQITNDQITNDHIINDDLFENDQITNDQITHDQITNDQITNDQITNDQITNDQITNDQITNDQITNDQITNDQITNDQITNDQIINDDQLENDQIANYEITNDDLLEND